MRFGTGELECLESYLVRRETRISDCCRLRASRAHSAVERIPLNEKVQLLCKYVRFLGMINGNGLVIPCPEKVISIVCLERPTDVKELQGFLGSVNWFRKHIASHAQIQFPLNQLTRKDAKWEWNAGCETA